MKRMTLEQRPAGHQKFGYLVKQVVDSTVPKVGAYLSEAEVASYCKNGLWNVTIKGQK